MTLSKTSNLFTGQRVRVMCPNSACDGEIVTLYDVTHEYGYFICDGRACYLEHQFFKPVTRGRKPKNTR